MKTLKLHLFACCSLLALTSFAQNTFPTSGNVGIGTGATSPKAHLSIGSQGLNGSLLNLNWTYDTNWNGNADKWSGFIGFNAYRNNNEAKDYFSRSNNYTKRFVFEGGNNGFRWLGENTVPNRGAATSATKLTELMALKSNGNMGIGVTDPQAQLTVGNNFGASVSGAPGGHAIFGTNLAVANKGTNRNKVYTPYTHNNNYGYAGIHATWGRLLFYTNRSNTTGGQTVSLTPRMAINNNGNVGIGTSSPSEKLTVKGKILCEEVEVVVDANAPDYVFETYYDGSSKLKPSYVMPTLEEVEAYTKANNHLPEVPSAEAFKKDGLELKDMSMLLLQKIEELTLYTIAQEKRIKLLEARLND